MPCGAGVAAEVAAVWSPSRRPDLSSSTEHAVGVTVNSTLRRRICQPVAPLTSSRPGCSCIARSMSACVRSGIRTARADSMSSRARLVAASRVLVRLVAALAPSRRVSVPRTPARRMSTATITSTSVKPDWSARARRRDTLELTATAASGCIGSGPHFGYHEPPRQPPVGVPASVHGTQRVVPSACFSSVKVLPLCEWATRAYDVAARRGVDFTRRVAARDAGVCPRARVVAVVVRVAGLHLA